MSDISKATPRPWRIATKGNLGNSIEGPSGKSYYDGDDGYRCVASFQECTASHLYHEQQENCQANGELIVRAVNERDNLLRERDEIRAEVDTLKTALSAPTELEMALRAERAADKALIAELAAALKVSS